MSDLRLIDEAENQWRDPEQLPLGGQEKTIRHKGEEFILRLWPGTFPHTYDWDLRSMRGVLMARLACVRGAADDHPEASARYCLRQGEPQKACRCCQKERREVWCELWRNGPGNRERMTEAERREYARDAR